MELVTKATSQLRCRDARARNVGCCVCVNKANTANTAPFSRRTLLGIGVVVGVNVLHSMSAQADMSPDLVEALEAEAGEAYMNRDFTAADDALTQLTRAQPQSPRWREMRAAVLVDNKRFDAALADYDAALSLTPQDDLANRARLLAGRALAYEGLAQWRAALGDYDDALRCAAAAGYAPDPYVLNSKGNVFASLEQWSDARAMYMSSARAFQSAKGFRGRGGSTTQRLDGAVYAQSNAALMLAQLGDLDGAVKEMEYIARRAPGSADIRAALAALYWNRGRQQDAEASWEFACNKITVGCSKYNDEEWLRTIRRWPPTMVARMQDFLKIRAPRS